MARLGTCFRYGVATMLPPSLCCLSHAPAATTSGGAGLSLGRALGPAAFSRLSTDCAPTRVTERVTASRAATKSVRLPDRGDSRTKVTIEAVGETAVGGQAAEEQQQGPHQQGEARKDVRRALRVLASTEHEPQAEQAEPENGV